MKGKYLDWNQYAICAICGKSGSGKTSTTRFLLAQLAMNGVGLIVGDYHGMLDRDNLASTIEALQPAMIRPIAKNRSEIIESIKYVNQLLEDRLSGNGDTRRVALVLDEVAAFFIGCEREELDMIARMFLRLANEGRKCNIRVFLLSQSFLSDFVGSRSVRSSITHVIFHRSNEDEVKLLAPSMPTNVKREIARLKTGHVYFYPDMQYLQVPYITQDDLAQVKIPQIGWRAKDTSVQNIVQHSERLQHAVNAPLHDKKNDSFLREMIEKPVNVQSERQNARIEQVRIVKEIMQSIGRGESKEVTIRKLFNTYKSGRNQKWVIASRLYDTIKERMNDK